MLSNMLWTLLTIQIAMGAFDTIYHHELTERLAWRPTQRLELMLHGVRNSIYAAVFLMLGFSQPSGVWALLLMALFLIEAGITLWDFVEEDRTRKLPASERLTHTLLTLNYGLILALLLPVLWTAAQGPDALPWMPQGWMALIFGGGALGVLICGLRDIAAARRAQRLGEDDPAGLMTLLGAQPQSVLVTGGTGLVGSRLVEALIAAGHDAIVLSRRADAAMQLPGRAQIIASLDALPDHTRIDAIVHLAGESVAGGLWTQKRKARIIASRVDMANDLHRLCQRLTTRPRALIAASAIGYYGDAGDDILDEGAIQRPGFAGQSCAAVEQAADRFAGLGLRVIKLRIALVLARQGGLLGNLLFPFEWGMGGPIGDGRQYMSWIHRDDLVRMIGFLLGRDDLHGVFNAAAPEPVRQRDFARALGRALGRPALIPLPAFVLRWLPGGMGQELFLASQRVLPVRVIFEGFGFRHLHIGSALDRICGAPVRMDMHKGKGAAWAEARLLH